MRVTATSMLPRAKIGQRAVCLLVTGVNRTHTANMQPTQHVANEQRGYAKKSRKLTIGKQAAALRKLFQELARWR